MNNLSITLVQVDLIWQDRTANFLKLEKLLSKSEQIGDIIVLPEMFSTGFSMTPENLWDVPEGESLEWMKVQAKRLDAAICGSLIIKEADQFYNRLYFVRPSGSFEIYDKKHLFTLAGEEKIYSPGKKQLILEYKGWRIMPLICYDLRFPVWCRNTQEADLQIFVANWPERRREPWRALLRARAIENMCYLVGLNRIGEDGNGVSHSGDSGVYNELGDEVLSLTPFNEEVKTIKLSRQSMLKSRERFQFLSDGDSFTFLG